MIKNQAEKLKSRLIEEINESGFQVTGVSEKQYHFEIVASDGTNKNNLNIFFGKKGIKTIVQGQTGTFLYETLCSLTGKSIEAKSNGTNIINYIGSDESGKGDFFGPLVVCAVYFNEKISSRLSDSGIRDSKLLSSANIYKVAPVILKEIDGNFAVRVVEPETYNTLYSEIKNLNTFLENLHREVIEELLEKVKPEKIIIDQFSQKRFLLSSKFKNSDVQIIQETGAEKYSAVAAASILARYFFEEWFFKMKDKGFNLPKGASAAVEEEASLLFKEKGEMIFREISKLHFKTYKKIISDT